MSDCVLVTESGKRELSQFYREMRNNGVRLRPVMPLHCPEHRQHAVDVPSDLVAPLRGNPEVANLEKLPPIKYKDNSYCPNCGSYHDMNSCPNPGRVDRLTGSWESPLEHQRGRDISI